MDANLNEHIVLLICQHTSYVLPHICLYVSALTWWRHQMETFSALLALGVGNSRSPVNSPHKGQWRGALMFSWICTWINGWYNREAGDLRHHHAHYDATVMNTLRPHRTNAEVFFVNWTYENKPRRYKIFRRKCIWKCRPFCPGFNVSFSNKNILVKL